MRAGIGDPTDIPPNTFVVNVSAINTHNTCDRRWYHERVDNRVANIATPAEFLVNGTVGHQCIQELHEQMGTWAPEAAIGIAHKHAQRLTDEAEQKAQFMTTKQLERRAWFTDWLPRAFPLYAAKWKSAPWTEQVMVEEALWLLLEGDETDLIPGTERQLHEAGYAGVLLVGRPDAIVAIHDQLWHVQRKFFSPHVRLEDFLDHAPFAKHEVVYLTMLQQLRDQDEPRLPKLPVGHTMFDIIVKKDIPKHPDLWKPYKLCKCGSWEWPEYDDERMLTHHRRGSYADPNIRRKHWEHERGLPGKSQEHKAEVEHAFKMYNDRAFVRHEAIISSKQRKRVMADLLYDVSQMAAKAKGLVPTTPKEGWACSQYHQRCPYVGVCAGRESIEGPQFAKRPEDYTDVGWNNE